MALSLNELKALLETQSDLTVSLENDAILLGNEDGVDAFLTVSGEQILVEALLCPVSQIKDPIAFNDVALRSHKNMFSLTSIGITSIAGDDFYVAFGALSSESKPESVLIEIDTLFLNVEGMIEFFEAYLG
ncbi:MAG: DUF2170 family protein [Motiliproteus sp.]